MNGTECETEKERERERKSKVRQEKMRKVAKREQVQGNVFFCCQMVCRECVCFCTYLLGRLMYSCVCLCEGFTKVRFFPRDLGEKGRKREIEREESV